MLVVFYIRWSQFSLKINFRGLNSESCCSMGVTKGGNLPVSYGIFFLITNLASLVGIIDYSPLYLS